MILIVILLVLVGSGWFWLVLIGFGLFWLVLAGSGWFWLDCLKPILPICNLAQYCRIPFEHPDVANLRNHLPPTDSVGSMLLPKI